MFLFFDLHTALSAYLLRSQIAKVAEAYLFAADAHETQKRSSGEPYITHPVQVAIMLARLQMDAETVIAALLHDVIEDTDVKFEDVERHFGHRVARLVDGVSKLEQIEFQSRAYVQAESLRKMMLAMAQDIRVILIKLADRLHNMQTLDTLSFEKRYRIAKETLDILVPIAQRLGMNAMKTALEDLCFKTLYPLRYKVLHRCVLKARGNRRKLMEKILSILAARLEEFGVSSDCLTGREKRLYSIYQKMQHRSAQFSEIMDVYAFRIIAKDRQDCYRLLGILHSIFKPVPGRFKDYIAIPKANGYQSLHTTLFGPHGVPIEIQIRTIEMERIAEQGIAAHWRYKSLGSVSEAEVRTREWLMRMMEVQKHNQNALEFIEDLKIELFQDEVYVFTPKGEIKALPHGGTALDFAYAVHTDIGNHCSKVKVNRRFIDSLGQPLRSGQTVEILTDPTVTPSSEWLDWVVTGRAKTAIRQFLKSGQLVKESRNEQNNH